MLRIRWWGMPSSDVEAVAEGYHTVGDLLTAAAEAAGVQWEPTKACHVERTGERVDPDTELKDAGIVSGDTLTFDLAAVDRSVWTTPDEAVSCDITQGPAAGRSFVLSPGRHAVGSDLSCAVTIHDPTVAPFQAWIVVDDDLNTTIEPQLGTINPTLVNAAAPDEPRPIGRDDLVQMGATAMTIRHFRRATAVTDDGLGQLPFIRTPRRAVTIEERKIEAFDRLPVKPDPVRFTLISAILPLASGLSLFAFTRQPQFLMLTLLSPVAAVGNWFEGRRRGKAKYANDVLLFDERLRTHVDAISEALRAERADRIAASPDLADLVRRSQLRTHNLWERDRASSDFLTLRLGIGDHPSNVVVSEPQRGDDEYRERAVEATAFSAVVPASPSAASLATLGALGIQGSRHDTGRLVNSLVMQATALHSPEDLVLAVIAGDPAEDQLSTWVRWLPHTRSGATPINGPHVVVGDDGNELLRELIAVGRFRTDPRDRADHRWPWILLVITDTAPLESSLLSQVLDVGPEAGISVVFTETSIARIRRQAAATVELHDDGEATVNFVDADMVEFPFTPELASDGLTDRFALAMAPLRDASAASTTSAIPRVVPLFSLFDGVVPTVPSIAAVWAQPEHDGGEYALKAVIGRDVSGPLEIDLVDHGPHALIGGTSGAGKSELLQSIVAGLISRYPPTRLTFLFVDYKGGASSAVFSGIPHTVGYVTNLEESLALRALESLRAELNRRMEILARYECKDVADLLSKHPEAAPPSLVIIVDEFATLVKEVPEFIAGVVDVAQRGRSLGIHLILATQRPSGSVNDNILANTNLRISLRMLDGAESTAILGVPTAAEIPLPLKGRAFAKLGPRDIVEFQSGFTGAPLDDDNEVARVECHVISGTRATNRAPRPAPSKSKPSSGGERTTQLDLLLNAVIGARPDLPAPHKPWRDELPTFEPFDTLCADDDVATADKWPHTAALLIGRFDEPGRQQQDPRYVDLEQQGGLLIAGAGGSGKSTALRTLVGSAIADASPSESAVIVIDGASRSLASVQSLAHCAGYASGDDLEAITRTIDGLRHEISRRRSVFANHPSRADSLTAYLQAGGQMPRVLVVIDGYQSLVARLREPGMQVYGTFDWLDGLNEALMAGRQTGIHIVIAADRRQAVPASLLSSIGARLALRQMEESAFTDLGVPISLVRGATMSAGRGVLDGQMLQIACIGDDATPNGQAVALESIDQRHPGSVPGYLQTSAPHDVLTSTDPPSRPNTAVLGAADVTGETVEADLSESGLLIVGPPRSGRSTALAQIASSLAAGGTRYWAIGLNESLRPRSDTGRHAARNVTEATELLTQLAAHADLSRTKQILLVDDVERLDDGTLGSMFASLEEAGQVVLVAAFNVLKFSGYHTSPLVKTAKEQPNVMFLRPENALEVLQVVGLRADLRPGLPMRAGRGLLIVDRVARRIQIFEPRQSQHVASTALLPTTDNGTAVDPANDVEAATQIEADRRVEAQRETDESTAPASSWMSPDPSTGVPTPG